MLASAGAAAGIGVAWLLLNVLLALAPPELARVHGATLDARVLLVAVALGGLTALLVGALPAWRAFGRDPRQDLSSARGVTADPRTRRLHAALVALQVALAVVLLVAGGLLLRSFAALSRVDPGFRTEGLVTADVLIPPDRYKSRVEVLQFFERLEERLAAQSGVLAVSAIDRLPYGPLSSQVRLRIVGRPSAPGTADPVAFNASARPGYFRAMGIPVLHGREFTAHDRTDSPAVVIIGRSVAARHWPGGDALGARVTVFGVDREIVGIVDDVRHFGPATPFDPMIYLPQSQDLATRRAMTVVARAGGSPEAVQVALRNAIRGLDLQLPISNLRSFGELRSERTASQRFNALVIGSFGLLSLSIAALGIYGVLSFVVAQRTHEIGIRAALGAQRGAVVGMILRQSLALTGTGLAIGVAAAAIATQYLERMLFGLEPLDPVTFAAVCGTFVAVALLSSYVPARRAANVDPLIALREG